MRALLFWQYVPELGSSAQTVSLDPFTEGAKHLINAWPALTLQYVVRQTSLNLDRRW